MVWIRLVGLLLVGCIWIFYCVYFLICFLSGNVRIISRHSHHLNKIPIINNFIDSKARYFDEKNVDAEVGQCAICIEDFKDNNGK